MGSPCQQHVMQGRESTVRTFNYLLQVKAISMALSETDVETENSQIVFFIDSQAAILAICSRAYCDHVEVAEVRRRVN